MGLKTVFEGTQSPPTRKERSLVNSANSPVAPRHPSNYLSSCNSDSSSKCREDERRVRRGSQLVITVRSTFRTRRSFARHS